MRPRTGDPFAGNDDRDWELQEVLLALREPGCPACLLAAETEAAALLWLREANLNDPGTVRRITAAGGLCARHWDALLSARGDDPGIGPGLLLLATARYGRPGGRARCSICEAATSRAAATLEVVMERLTVPGFRDGFDVSFGLCGPHHSDALARATPEIRRVLEGAYRAQVQRLSQRLEAGLRDPRGRAGRAHALAVKLGGAPPLRGGARMRIGGSG